ncbi:MAG: GMC oxidoreductase [Phycisphaerae bacterium]
MDIDDIEDATELRADVAVVGAGIAGIDLCRDLARRDMSVVLLESGRRSFDPEVQALARVQSAGRPVRVPSPDSPFTPYLPEIFRGEFRLRQFGGTANIWTGKWRTFDDLDFSRRDWIPFSGWPICRRDLKPYYDAVARDYRLGDFEAFEASPDVQAARAELAKHGLKLSFHYWEASATRPAARFGPELEQAPGVQVVLGANATRIVEDAEGRVSHVEFKSLKGKAGRVAAGQFVLATGGLEGARLMLASDAARAEGVGNANGLVGRFHMDHPKNKKAILHPGPAMRMLHRWTHTQPRPCFHVSLSLADDVQRELKLLDHAVYLSPVYDYAVDYARHLTEPIKAALAKKQFGSAAGGLLRLLASPKEAWKVLRRVCLKDRRGKVAHYLAGMYVEQAPNRQSRVRLGDEADVLGLPNLVLDWQLNEEDYRSFDATLAELARRFELAGLGRLDFGQKPPSLDDWADAAHHMGATRMAETPETGVVDKQCRVFGTQNLYVASSSVFPTGHSAAPTMTILAMARRLSEHLAGGHAKPADLQPSAAGKASSVEASK